MIFKLTSFYSAIFFMLLLSPLSKAEDESLIRWIQLDQPPAFIVKGEDQGQGYVDYVQKRLEKHLTEYRHYSLLVNSARHKSILNSDKNVCISYIEYYPDIPILAKDKEGHYLRTLPWSPHPVLELLMKKSVADSFIKSNNSIQLQKVLQNKKLVLGLPSKRWKGEISRLIKKYEKDIPVVWNSSHDFGSIFKMILKDRVNYTIAYPLWISYWEKEYKVPNGTIVSLEMEEMNYPYIRVAVGCRNNAWGKKIVAKINLFLRAEVPTIAWRNNMERWLPKKDVANYRDYYNTMLLESYGHLDTIK